MNEKFTKGEWEVKRTLISDFRIKVIDKKGKQGKIIGDIRNADNANLIAAAPDMYEMLQGLYENACSIGDDSEWVDEIREVLAKARGDL